MYDGNNKQQTKKVQTWLRMRWKMRCNLNHLIIHDEYQAPNESPIFLPDSKNVVGGKKRNKNHLHIFQWILNNIRIKSY